MTIPLKARRAGNDELVDVFAKAIDLPPDVWYGKCHAVSLAIVESGIIQGPARVARGTCERIPSQHSWISLGDPYDPETRYVDPTSWCWTEDKPRIWTGKAKGSGRTPKGALGRNPAGELVEHIMAWGRPSDPKGPIIELTPTFELSAEARFWLDDMLGPLDREGWAVLSSAPVGGWAAGEIFAAMDDTEELAALVPIDVLGMTTDRNPCGLYLAGEDTSGAARRARERGEDR